MNTMSEYNIFGCNMFDEDDIETVYEDIQSVLIYTGESINDYMTDDDIAVVCHNASKYVSLLWGDRFVLEETIKALAFSMYDFIVKNRYLFGDEQEETTVEDIADGLMFANINAA